jgi:hypothetical protein
LAGTPFRAFIESKENERASKTKEMTERQLKGLEATKTEPSNAIQFHILISRLCWM